MTSVTMDRKNAAALTAGGMMEVRDEDGQVIGFFAPVALPEPARYADAAAHFFPTKDDHAARPDEKTYTTAEVREHLQKLGAN